MKPFNNSKTDWILVTAVKENSLGHQFGLQVPPVVHVQTLT